MSNQIADEQERLQALNPAQSFIVQAPAGSGKTELLTQRFLVLLSYVSVPEEILAITFTKKAAAEMRARIIKTFHAASNEPEPAAPHAKKTWQLAKNALAQDAKHRWNLLSNPNRLRIQTIDSFNASLNKNLPILSHFGAPPEITDDPLSLYREAVQEFLSHLEENLEWSDAIANLLMHRDNNFQKLQNLLIKMLAKRDQWLPYMMVDTDPHYLRHRLETQLTEIVDDIIEKVELAFPALERQALLKLAAFAFNTKDFNQTSTLNQESWNKLANLLLTKELKWRKSFDKRIGFPAPSAAKTPAEKNLFKELKTEMENLVSELSQNNKLLLALTELKLAPACCYTDEQWEILHSLYRVLKIVVAQLRVTFRNHNKIDYIENAQAALMALGTETAPTDLALALDYQIKHILIDEFQDTSNSQYRLLEKLIAGWDNNDGRTLFVVGDPMQSIYRFREAEVGLFIRARKQGIHHINLIPLTLSVNFRSTPTIVDWINNHFEKVLSSYEDISTGAVAYTHSLANQAIEKNYSRVQLHPNAEKNPAAQADGIVKLILETKKENPSGSIAILVRARSHLEYIIPALKSAQLPYRAIKIDPLDSRTVIQDLIALTKALLNPADRVAWLAVLRSPFCGLSLSDLLQVSGRNALQTIFEIITNSNLENISDDGKCRLHRVSPILKNKMLSRKRYSLRMWIESTWLALGGAACVKHSHDLNDAEAYFTLLEKLDVGSDIFHLDDLENYVGKLFASPNHEADNSLQIMTIHNAKGLEFDTVILPYLEKQAPNDEKQLLLWMEKTRETGENALILAAINAAGQDDDSIYNYIKAQHKLKSENEMGRLLYVAATRAKSQLHLFFSMEENNSENNYEEKNSSRSLLDKLWPAIKHEVNIPSIDSSNFSNKSNKENYLTRFIYRLPAQWENPISEIKIPISHKHQSLPGFRLDQNNLRIIGTSIHKLFEIISKKNAKWWENQSIISRQNFLNKQLLTFGMLRSFIPEAISIIFQAVKNTLADPRGQWILSPHKEAKSELPLTALIDGEISQLIIDRTFIDENGNRWIIDYKTTLLGDLNLTDFLSHSKQDHEAKMLQYYQALNIIDNRPTFLGLYFPLIPAWQEWAITKEMLSPLTQT